MPLKTNWEHILNTDFVNAPKNEPNVFETSSRNKKTEPLLNSLLKLHYSRQYNKLDDKTQVTPVIYNSIFDFNAKLRTRGKHSEECGLLGRKTGGLIGEREKDETLGLTVGLILEYAGKVHDLQSLPFGHTSERTVSSFFEKAFNGQLKKIGLTRLQQEEFKHFDANPMTLRELLRKPELNATKSAVAACIKSPRGIGEALVKGTKFGYFESDKEAFEQLAEETGMPRRKDGTFGRHPLAHLLEAIDDISYALGDLLDFVYLGYEQPEKILNLYARISGRENCSPKSDNQATVFLRKYHYEAVQKTLSDSLDIFYKNKEAIFNGTYEGEILKEIPNAAAFQEAKKIALPHYKNRDTILFHPLASGKNIPFHIEEWFGFYLNCVFGGKDTVATPLLEKLQYFNDGELQKQTTAYGKILTVSNYFCSTTDNELLKRFRQMEELKNERNSAEVKSGTCLLKGLPVFITSQKEYN